LLHIFSQILSFIDFFNKVSFWRVFQESSREQVFAEKIIRKNAGQYYPRFLTDPLKEESYG
jgi:hypothetical protein